MFEKPSLTLDRHSCRNRSLRKALPLAGSRHTGATPALEPLRDFAQQTHVFVIIPRRVILGMVPPDLRGCADNLVR